MTMAHKGTLDKKVLLISNEGRVFFPRKDGLHTKDGHISSAAIKKAKPGQVLKTNTGKEFSLIKPGFLDFHRKLTRGAQIVLPKDIGSIVAYTGVNGKSRVIDAGAGSGALACFLANIAKDVVTYDMRDDHLAVVRENIHWFDLKNVIAKKGDIREPIREKNRDVMTLDIPDPWNALDTAALCLKVGGYLTAYVPNIPQAERFVKAVDEHPLFLQTKTLEVIEREWQIQDRRVRPKTQGLMHTAFLVFTRKIRGAQ